jgi:predicted aldo/keto reductase-like oxidoreductase
MVFSCVNDAALFDDLAFEQRNFRAGVQAGHTAPLSACEACGQCEEACPQTIKIPEELKKAATILA